MDFQVFLTSILKIEREPLLADLAHQIMVPPERIELLKKSSSLDFIISQK